MAAEVLHLRSPLRWSKDWSQQEIAEFYRVESALIQAGFALQTDRGLSDEGDPWFVFCRADTTDVFIHFARIDGEYVVDAGPLGAVVHGSDFRTLVRDLVEKQPLVQARTRAANNIFLHPAALLIALVGGAFFHSNEAKAATSHADHGHGHGHTEWRRQIVLSSGPVAGDTQSQVLDSTQVAAILTGVMFGLDRQMDLAPSPAPPSSPYAAPHTPSPMPLVASFDPKIAPPAHDVSTAVGFQVTPAYGGGRGGGADADGLGGGGGGSDPAAVAHLSLAIPAETPLIWPETLAAPAVMSFQVTPAFSGAAIGADSAGDAAQVVQNAEIAANVTTIALVPLTRLPPAVADLFAHGSHPAAPATTTNTDTNTDTNTGAGVDANGGSPPGPVITVHAGFQPNDPTVIAAVAGFLSSVGHVDMVATGPNTVIYDDAIMHLLPLGTQLAELTINFVDGSTLALVGTAAEIQALHWAQ